MQRDTMHTLKEKKAGMAILISKRHSQTRLKGHFTVMKDFN